MVQHASNAFLRATQARRAPLQVGILACDFLADQPRFPSVARYCSLPNFGRSRQEQLCRIDARQPSIRSDKTSRPIRSCADCRLFLSGSARIGKTAIERELDCDACRPSYCNSCFGERMPLGLTASGLRIFRFGMGGASWRHWRGQHVLPTCRRSIDQSRATTELRLSGACNFALTAAAASGGGQPLPAPVWLQWPSMRHGGGRAQQVSSRLAFRCSQGLCKRGGVPGELVLPGGPGQCTRIVCPY